MQVGETQALNTEMLHQVKMLNERVASLERGVARAASLAAAAAASQGVEEPEARAAWAGGGMADGSQVASEGSTAAQPSATRD